MFNITMNNELSLRCQLITCLIILMINISFLHRYYYHGCLTFISPFLSTRLRLRSLSDVFCPWLPSKCGDLGMREGECRRGGIRYCWPRLLSWLVTSCDDGDLGTRDGEVRRSFWYGRTGSSGLMFFRLKLKIDPCLKLSVLYIVLKMFYQITYCTTTHLSKHVELTGLWQPN